MDFQTFLARVREETGLNFRQLAGRCKMNEATLRSQLERSRKVPFALLTALQDADLHYLFTGVRLEGRGGADPVAREFIRRVAQYPAMRTVVLSLAATSEERRFFREVLRVPQDRKTGDDE